MFAGISYYFKIEMIFIPIFILISSFFCICFQDQSRKLKHTENVKRWGAKKEKQAKQCEANKGKFFSFHIKL